MPSLSRRILERIDAYLVSGGVEHPCPDELIVAVERALAPKRSAAPARKRREEKRKSRRERTAEVRAAVMERAGGRCECCGVPFSRYVLGAAPTLDHYFGRARAESIETCWALAYGCHRQKTENRPDALTWVRRFAAHARRYGYEAEAQLAERRLAE